MPTQDQVVWANCNVLVGSAKQPFPRGALLPEPSSAEEVNERLLLRLGGAIRTVEVVYTAGELAAAAQQRAEATAARESALDVDAAAPLGQQVPGGAQHGPPTLAEPSGSPVVVAEQPRRAAGGQFAPKGGAKGGAKES